MTTTDTPRTDACPHCGARVYALLGVGETTYWQCDSDLKSDGSVVRSELCCEREARQKAEAKVQELDRLLTYSLKHSEKFREWAEAEVERLRDAMRKIQDLAVIKANKCLGCAASEEEAYRALNPTDK